jgi:ADP-ribose pyrophosphatase YjhB (NUDIX family)
LAQKGSYTYDYPRPEVGVDGVLFRTHGSELQVLLIQRGNEPFKWLWTLPGGYIELEETLEESVRRELAEETGITDIPLLVQLGAYGEVKRDPRGRVISVAYMGIVPSDAEPNAGDDAADAEWTPLSQVPDELAFDHDAMLEDALATLSTEGEESGFIFAFLPKTFDRDQLASVMAALYGDTVTADECLEKFISEDLIRKHDDGKKFEFKGSFGELG